MSRIDELMIQFSRIPHASVGHGPRHPSAPAPEVGPRVARFLDDHPALRRDHTYVEFLEKYAGASIENEGFSQIVDILGFTDASTDMEEMDGSIVDGDGFLMFAEAVYHLREGPRNVGTWEHAFAFQVRDERAHGVYHSLVSDQSLTVVFRPAFASFEAWLSDVIARGGWLDPPGR